MSYIGKAPGFGIRNRYYYTATASQTTFSGADDNGQTLAYADSKYLDVYLNGVLLVAGTDYTATTLTSVTLTSGAAASDIVEIVAYDIFSVADTVSAANGGTFDGEVTFADGVVVSGGTGDNTLSIPDNLASAFDITESTNSYLKFVTTDSSEAIVAGKTLQTALVEPTTDDSSDLGTSSKRFQDLYLSGGAYIGGTTSANFLDDYEVGTWTPTFANIGTGTYDTQEGRYVKIGDLVHIQCFLAMATLGTASGNLIVQGIPFTMQSITVTSQMWTNSWASNGENVVGLRGTGSNTLQMYRITNTNASTVSHADLGSIGNFLFNMTYNTTQ